MTINTTSNKTIALGDGVATAFDFDFIGVAAAYIGVTYTDPSGVATVLTQGAGLSQYQIALNSPVAGVLWGMGGTVTYAPAGSPIPDQSTLTIVRTLPLLQAITLQNMISLATLGAGAEQGLDTLTMLLQQIGEVSNRAILANITNTSLPEELPPAAECAGKGAVFSADGFSIIPGVTPASGIISAAMAAVVGAATLALGRTAFGLGNMAVENIGSGLQDDGGGAVRVNAALVAIATNQAIAAASHLKRYIATGPITLTLARANTLWNGFGFWVEAYGSAVIITPNASDAIEGLASGASIIMPPGWGGFITTDAAGSGNWRVEWFATAGPSQTVGGVVNLFTGYNAGTPNTSVDITADAVVLSTATGAGMRFNTVSVTINALVNGANGLDTGALANNTWYYKFLIGKPDGTIAGLLSMSATAPAMPTGYTMVKRVGAVRTDGSAHFKLVIQRGNAAMYQGATPGVTIASGAAGLAGFSTAASIPPTAAKMRGVLAFSGATSGNASVYGVNSTQIPLAQAGANASTTNISIAQHFDCVLEDSKLIYYAAGGSGFSAASLVAVGWDDNI